jgi:hypothetical protein
MARRCSHVVKLSRIRFGCCNSDGHQPKNEGSRGCDLRDMDMDMSLSKNPMMMMMMMMTQNS